MHTPVRRSEDKELLLDILTGAAAGAAGVWVMDRVSTYMYEKESREARQQEDAARPEGLDPAHAAVKKIADAFDANITPAQPNAAGVALHYLLGIVPGALYSAVWHRWKSTRENHGLVYGLVLFLVQDEGAGPLLGLSGKPAAYPKQAHLRGLISHLALGYTTDRIIRLISGRKR